MIKLNLFCVIFATVLLSACEDEPESTLKDSITTAGPASNYDLSNSVIPFPNDLLFDGTTTGTLNIPVADPDDLSDPQVALNGVDGFSTVAPMSTSFSSALDPTSVDATSVRVFEVVKGGGLAGPVTSVASQLTFGVDYIASVSSVDSTGSTLVVLPLKPLKGSSSYAVMVTDDLTGTNGKPVAISSSYLLTRSTDPIANLAATPPFSADDIYVGVLKPDSDAVQAGVDEAYATAAKLEGLRQFIVNPSESVLLTDAGNADIVSSDVVLHWTFTTQSITDVLTQVRSDVIAEAPTSAVNPTALPGTPPVAADIFAGALNVPYYLAAASGVNDLAPLDSFWKGVGDSLLTSLAPNPGCIPAGTNVCPVANSTEAIPMMVSLPKTGVATKPAAGWPVVIYQHGITTNRATMLAVADSMASAGFAVVAIDLPMHGLTGNEVNGTQFFKDTVNGERTFDLDLVTQDAITGDIIASLSDGITDSSGRHFINLANLQNSRDNFRKAVSDLFALTFAISAMDIDGGGADLDDSQIYFMGHSLGGIVGLTYLALEPNTKGAVIAMSGGGIAKLLDGSASFGPSIAAGLAANSVIKGSADYESFLGAAQTLIDSGDPINHTMAAAASRSIVFFEVVGGGGVPSDLVVPNSVPDGNDTSGTVPAPLSGTIPLVGVDSFNTGLGLTQYDASSTIPTSPLALVRFNSGDHGSLLSPAASLDVTTEMQTEAANFFGSSFLGAPTLIITNGSVVVAVP